MNLSNSIKEEFENQLDQSDLEYEFYAQLRNPQVADLLYFEFNRALYNRITDRLYYQIYLQLYTKSDIHESIKFN
jgi:hypothetical protein